MMRRIGWMRTKEVMGVHVFRDEEMRVLTCPTLLLQKCNGLFLTLFQ